MKDEGEFKGQGETADLGGPRGVWENWPCLTLKTPECQVM